MSKKASRFGFAASSNSSSASSDATKTASTYFASARLKNEKLKNYFDDSDDEVAPVKASSTAPIDDDYDPLDAFM